MLQESRYKYLFCPHVCMWCYFITALMLDVHLAVQSVFFSIYYGG